MADYSEPIGRGGAWINESQKGVKYLRGEITFQYNGHQVTAKISIFKNNKKEGKRPDYNILVSDAFPAKPREKPTKEENDSSEDLPF